MSYYEYLCQKPINAQQSYYNVLVHMIISKIITKKKIKSHTSPFSHHISTISIHFLLLLLSPYIPSCQSLAYNPTDPYSTPIHCRHTIKWGCRHMTPTAWQVWERMGDFWFFNLLFPRTFLSFYILISLDSPITTQSRQHQG